MTTGYRYTAQTTTTSEEDGTTSSSSDEDAKPYLGVLYSPTSEYWIQAYLGQGVYGQVLKCVKAATRETVAVKVMKDSNLTPEIENELDILSHLREFDPDKYNFVQFRDVFVDSGRVCLEFELLDANLWDFVGRRPSRSLSLKEIRPILHQMATTLELLRNQGVAHTDLKLDNIMLVDHANQPWRAKMIDFGLACFVSESEWGNYLQPRYYRSPEVILGIPFTAAADMWSLGCIAAELFLGSVLYPGNNEYEMLRYIIQTQGNLPQRILNYGIKTRCFFRRRRCRQRKHVWKLKTPKECGYANWNRHYMDSLDSMKNIRPPCYLSEEDNMAEMEDRDNFIDLLKSMLHLDVDKRITPAQLLQDPFITMKDLTSNYPNSFYVKSCCELMQVCEDLSLNPAATDPWLNPQPSTSTAYQDQQGFRQAPPAWHSREEHPAIVGITSDLSSSLSINKDKSNSQPIQSGAQSSTDRVRPARKRRRDTSSGERSPTSKLPERKRMKMDLRKPMCQNKPRAPFYIRKRKLERMRKLRQNRQATTDDVKGSNQIKSQDQWTWENLKEYSDRKSPDTHSPEEKKKMDEINPGAVQTLKDLPQDSREAPAEVKSIMSAVKPQRKRMWATFIDSYTGLGTPVTGSPERKRRKMSHHDDSQEAPTAASNREAEIKPMKKTRKRSLDDSQEAPTAASNREAEIKHTRKTRKRNLDDSQKAPIETPSTEVEIKPSRKRKRSTDEEETQTKKRNKSVISSSKSKDSSSDNKNRDCAPPKRKRRRKRRRISLEKQWTRRKCRKRSSEEDKRPRMDCGRSEDGARMQRGRTKDGSRTERGRTKDGARTDGSRKTSGV